MIKHLLCQCCYLSKGNSFEPLMAELSPFEFYTIYKKREKLHKHMQILKHHCRGQMKQILFKFRVEQHPKPVLLFIKAQLIWASHCRVITFRVLHDLQKTWKIAQNMYILQHHWRGQMIQILFKFRVVQHPKPVLLFIKWQLIWAAHGRVITFRVLHDSQKTWKNSTKICKICTSL